MKRIGFAVLTLAIMLGTVYYAGTSAGEQYERNHVEYLRRQNKLLERQNDLLRDQVLQVKRIADLIENGQRESKFKNSR